MTDARLRNLYWIAAVLVAIRFVLVPWLEWQNDRHDALVVLTKRLDRSVGVIENRAAIERSSKELSDARTKYRAFFREADSLEAFKLSAQQEISSVVSQMGLRVTLFDWVVDKFDDPPPVMRARARIQFAGPIPSLASVHGRLETQFPALVVREVRVDPQYPTSVPADTPGSMTLVMDLYFRPRSGGSAP